jgi:uncharacterized protein YjaZ
MKKRIVFCMLLLLIFLSACSEKKNSHSIHIEDLPSQKTMEFSNGDQSFRIIPFYEETLDYIEFVEENSLLNTLGTFNHTVMDPLRKEIHKQKMILKREIPPNVTITNDVEKLKGYTAELIRHQDETNEIIKEALTKSSKIIEGGDKAVYILPVNPEFPMKGMGGVAAWTLDDDVILLLLNSSYKQERLAYTVAHEYHHAILMESGSGYDSILDFVIFEGKGDTFANIVYPEVEVPWSQKGDGKELEVSFSQLKEYGQTSQFEIYYEWERGNASMNIPKWANYRMGSLMMQSYLKGHGDVPIKEWTDMDAEKILLESGYKEYVEDS